MDTMRRILGAPWDLAALDAYIDRAAMTVLSHAPGDPRTTADLQSFRDNLPIVRATLARRKAWASRLASDAGAP